MALALRVLWPAPECLLIDYLRLPDVPLPQECMPRGDALVLSIAAASIVAKVSRDRMMAGLEGVFPGYGFARHKGYGTEEHQAALACLGPSAAHRLSFAPLRRPAPAHDGSRPSGGYSTQGQAALPLEASAVPGNPSAPEA